MARDGAEADEPVDAARRRFRTTPQAKGTSNNPASGSSSQRVGSCTIDWQEGAPEAITTKTKLAAHDSQRADMLLR